MTEEEIRALIEQGTQAGMFEEAEQEMVERVFRLGDRRVSAVMTPRTEIVWLDREASAQEIRRTITESVHSRFLVADGSLDNVLGVVHAKDLLAHMLGEQVVNLEATLQQPLYVPESMRALKVLELFKQSGTHIALVIDEYGGIQGLVTPSDILEAIVGDLPEAGEQVDPLAVQRADGSWLLDGMLPVDEFKDLFDLGELPGEDQGIYQTLAGFVIMQLGRIPVGCRPFCLGGTQDRGHGYGRQSSRQSPRHSHRRYHLGIGGRRVMHRAIACVPEQTLSPIPLASRRPRPSHPLWNQPRLARRRVPGRSPHAKHRFLPFHFVMAFSRIAT